MVHELLADLPAETFARTEFYLAGPPPMVEAVVALLARRRVPVERIHYDRFFRARRARSAEIGVKGRPSAWG